MVRDKLESGPDEAGTGGAPSFRLDNERLAFRFTATRSDRLGVPVERLPNPARLDEWSVLNGLLERGDPVSSQGWWERALHLREAIHRIGTAIAQGSAPDGSDVEMLNDIVREAGLVPQLTAGTVTWTGSESSPTVRALGRVAHDAVVLFGCLEQSGVVKTCANPMCRGLYLDTSRAGNRRWCSMNVCGNREKKIRHRGPRPAGAPAPK